MGIFADTLKIGKVVREGILKTKKKHNGPLHKIMKYKRIN